MDDFLAQVRQHTAAIRETAARYRRSIGLLPMPEVGVILADTAGIIETMAEEIERRDNEIATLKRLLTDVHVGIDRARGALR